MRNRVLARGKNCGMDVPSTYLGNAMNNENKNLIIWATRYTDLCREHFHKFYVAYNLTGCCLMYYCYFTDFMLCRISRKRGSRSEEKFLALKTKLPA